MHTQVNYSTVRDRIICCADKRRDVDISRLSQRIHVDGRRIQWFKLTYRWGRLGVDLVSSIYLLRIYLTSLTTRDQTIGIAHHNEDGTVVLRWAVSRLKYRAGPSARASVRGVGRRQELSSNRLGAWICLASVRSRSSRGANSPLSCCVVARGVTRLLRSGQLDVVR